MTTKQVGVDTSQPRISYQRALRARFVWQDEMHTIGTCDQAILQAFLMHYGGIALHDNPHQLADALSCLDGYGDLGRWQAIDTLLLHKVMLPLLEG